MAKTFGEGRTQAKSKYSEYVSGMPNAVVL